MTLHLEACRQDGDQESRDIEREVEQLFASNEELVKRKLDSEWKLRDLQREEDELFDEQDEK